MTAAVVRLDDYRPTSPPRPVLFRDLPRAEQAVRWRRLQAELRLIAATVEVERALDGLDPAALADRGAELLHTVAQRIGYADIVFEDAPPGGGGSPKSASAGCGIGWWRDRMADIDDEVAAHLAAGGRIQKCPTAAVATTGAALAREDRARVRDHEDERAARYDEAARRRWGVG